MANVTNTYKEPLDQKTASKSELKRLEAPVVLMVSGGADSTALLIKALFDELDIEDGFGSRHIEKNRLYVLHVNHQLRGQDAVRDEEYVAELCRKYDLPLKVVRADVKQLAKDGDGNVENAGRAVRYGEANRLCNELSAKFNTDPEDARILSAHSASDRAETFIMNAMRGSALSGLSSIPKRRARIVRPLINCTHDELEEYLKERNISWVVDQTNKDTYYLRSFVRYEVLPLLKKKNPRVVSSLSQTSEILSDEEAYMAKVSAHSLNKAIKKQDEGFVALSTSVLNSLDIAIGRRVIRQALLMVNKEARVEFIHIEQALQVSSGLITSASLCEGIDCRCAHGLVYLLDTSKRDSINSGYLEVPGTFDLGDGRTIEARLINPEDGKNPVDMAKSIAQKTKSRTVFLDWAKVSSYGGKLWIDSPHAGDVMCPLGMGGKTKKLVDVLREANIPAFQKSSVPVVWDCKREHVVWVGGIRSDEWACCTNSSSILIELKFH